MMPIPPKSDQIMMEMNRSFVTRSRGVTASSCAGVATCSLGTGPALKSVRCCGKMAGRGQAGSLEG